MATLLLKATQIAWDGCDEFGGKLSAGVYFISLERGESNENCIEKVIKIK